MSVASLIKEMTSTKKFFKSRTDAGDDDMRAKFAASLKKQINECANFGTSEATAIQDALHDSPYGESGTASIKASIDAKLSTVGFQSMKGQQTMPSQSLKYWWFYPSPADWDVLEDPKVSFRLKMVQLVERGGLVGCTNPDEQSIKWMLAMLLAVHYKDLPEPQEIFAKLHDLKKCIETERMAFPLDHLPEFPGHPLDLPPDVYHYAYPEPDLEPVAKQLQGINAIAEKIPLRKNSKLLKTKRPPKRQPSYPESPKSIRCAVSQVRSVPVAGGGSLSMVPVAVKPEPNEWDPRDPVEDSYYSKYKADVWTHRTTGPNVAQTPSPSVKAETEQVEAASGHPSISIKRDSDGNLKLSPITFGKQPVASQPAIAKKEEPDAAAVRPDPEAPKANDSDSELDPYAQAALTALETRNANKRAEAAAKKKEDARLKKEEAAAKKKEDTLLTKPEAVLKRPAAKETKVEAPPVKIAKVAAAPKAAAAGERIETKKTIIAAMPSDTVDGTNPKPVLYCSGVIYIVQSQKKIRGLRLRGDAYTEISKVWGTKRTKAAAWKEVVSALEEYPA